MEINFNESQAARMKLTRTQRKQIRRMYKEAYREIIKKINKLNLSKVGARSDYVILNYALRDIQREYENLGAKLENLIEDNMKEVSKGVVEETANFASSVGMTITSGAYHLPNEIVNRIATGKVYNNSWTLSKAIWGNNQKILKDINNVIAKGVTMNKSAYEIAKDLERYVNPDARKTWEWSKIYPHTNKKVDYNAQRLARTLVSHAYQQSIMITTKDNPFVKGLRWLTANNHRVCPICLDRDGNIYKPEELPLDHPNGQCTYEPVIEDSMEEISNRIADWVNGKEDKGMDKYAEFLKNL